MKSSLISLSSVFLAASSLLCSCDAQSSAKADAQSGKSTAGSKLAAGTSPARSGRPRSRNAFAIESAKIEWRYTGAFEGKETFQFDQWGDRVVINTDRTEFGYEVKQTSIWNDKRTTIYKHNDPSKKAWRGRMRPRDTEPSSSAGLDQKQLESVGYVRLPDETIAGKTCEVYDNKGLKVKFWSWNGIELKLINHSLGEDKGYTREALVVETGVKIPDRALALPEGYTLGK